MIKLALVGLGKMGMSHLAIANAHPDVDVVGVCDPSGYVMSVLGKYTGLSVYDTFDDLLATGTDVDAVVISTPSFLHSAQVRQCLELGIHVFCEKPFCLDPADSSALAELAAERSLVTQVGYHNRYVGAFGEVKRLLDSGAIGTVSHALAEAYGPVVLKPAGGTWRNDAAKGGGSMYDYAAHPMNLLNWYFGDVQAARGSVLNSVFSSGIDDEVFATLFFDGGVTGQLSVNWSDESQRKMTTSIKVWGTHGKIVADRQEVQVYLREGAPTLDGYQQGWNVKYTTELTDEVWYYLRGEEYSAQMADFIRRVQVGEVSGVNDFTRAAATDQAIAMMVADASGEVSGAGQVVTNVGQRPSRRARVLAVGRQAAGSAVRRTTKVARRVRKMTRGARR